MPQTLDTHAVIPEKQQHQQQQQQQHQHQQQQQQKPEQQEARNSRRPIKTPSKFRDFDTTAAKVRPRSLGSSIDGSVSEPVLESSTQVTHEKRFCSPFSVSSASVASSVPTVGRRPNRIVRTPKKLADFQVPTIIAVNSPSKQSLLSEDTLHNVTVENSQLSENPADSVQPKAPAKSEILNTRADKAGGILPSLPKKRGRKPRMAKSEISSVGMDDKVEEDDDGVPFCGFTDTEIEKARSIASNNSSSRGRTGIPGSSLSAGRVRREAKTPGRLADFDTSRRGATKKDGLSEPTAIEHVSKVGQMSVERIETDSVSVGLTQKAPVGRRKRGFKVTLLSREGPSQQPAVKSSQEAHLAAKSGTSSQKKNSSSAVSGISDKENVVYQRVSSTATAIACHMVVVGVGGTAASGTASGIDPGTLLPRLQPLRKRGRPPSSKNSSQGTTTPVAEEDTGSASLAPAAKLPRLDPVFVSRDVGTPGGGGEQPHLYVVAPRRRGRGGRRSLSSRWIPGEFRCDICGRDCGYRQNLYVHLKSHMRRGEADSASTAGRGRGRGEQNLERGRSRQPAQNLERRGNLLKRGRRRREAIITAAAVDIMAAVSVRSAGPVMVARKNAGKELELAGGGDLDQKKEGEGEEGEGTASETPDPSR
jgi:hypothetical protein